MLKLGKTIKRIRNDLGITQGQLASCADVTPSFLCLLENDKRHPSTEVLRRIANALKVPEEVLIWDAVDVPNDLSRRDRRLCEMAKRIVRRYFEACDENARQD